MAKLRIGMTISGAVSLGAYEGRALAALLVAVQEMRGAVVIDALTGASAGAMTAVLAARCLLRGSDPVEAMTAAWVDLPALDYLICHDRASPLSAKVLAEGARRLLGDGNGAVRDGPVEARQSEDVRVALTMACLGGFEYSISSLKRETPVNALTYLDWADLVLKADSSAEDYIAAGELALASGANAAAFPPKLVRRSPEDIEQAKANGVKNPPGEDGIWYTDGGTIDNEPIGRLIDLLDEKDDAERLVVLVHPTPTRPPPASCWTDPTSQPRWSRTALRATKVKGVQSIYDDLRRLEKTNTRLVAVDCLVKAVDDALAPDDPACDRLKTALRHLIEEHAKRQVGLTSQLRRAPHASPPTLAADSTLEDLLRAAVHGAAGLAGKRPINVEVVSPDLDDSGLPSDELLAGERLSHFFGFVRAAFRQSDFALGYRNMTAFLERGLPRYGLGTEVNAVLPKVKGRYDMLGWDGIRRGNATLRDVTFREKCRVSRLGAHVAWIVRRDVCHWRQGLPVQR